MFHSSDESGRGSDAIADGNQSQQPVHFADFLPQGGKLTDLDLRSLPPGTELCVDTRNSRYRLLMLDGSGCNALVHGGRYFCQETEARIEGSTLGGSFLKVGRICLGLCLELSVLGKRIVTSRVRAINLQAAEK
jgi:hypothetical protein